MVRKQRKERLGAQELRALGTSRNCVVRKIRRPKNFTRVLTEDREDSATKKEGYDTQQEKP